MAAKPNKQSNTEECVISPETLNNRAPQKIPIKWKRVGNHNDSFSHRRRIFSVVFPHYFPSKTKYLNCYRIYQVAKKYIGVHGDTGKTHLFLDVSRVLVQ